MLCPRQDTNTVVVHDFGEDNGQPFMIMEYLAGGSWEDEIKGHKRLQPQEAVRVIHEACLGLVAIHKCGLTHRDVKPSNLLRSEGGG